MKKMVHGLESVSWYGVIVLMAMALLLATIQDSDHAIDQPEAQAIVGGNHHMEPPCEELYVVAEGETLYSIANKCGDPSILDRNPYLQDLDDVFPGIVIKLKPFSN